MLARRRRTKVISTTPTLTSSSSVGSSLKGIVPDGHVKDLSSSSVGNESDAVWKSHDDSCFRARIDTIPRYMYGNLSLPFINLGLPKMGTSSIQFFFGCAGYRALHNRCDKETACAECISKSARANQPPLQQCRKADVYSQMDGTIDKMLYFPQIELLEDFVREYPDATFLLTFRNVERWYESISNWPPPQGGIKFTSLKDRLRTANIPGLPPGKGKGLREFSDFFCGHVRRVREVVPPHRLVEIDIEDPNAASRMADVFDLDEACWAQANANDNLRKGENKVSTVGPVSWFTQGKLMLRGRNGTLRSRMDLPPMPIVKLSRGRDKIESIVTLGQAKNKSDMTKETASNADDHIHTVEVKATPNVRNHPRFAQKTHIDSSCNELFAHEKGYWHHDNLLLDPNMYYPEELNWLTGRNQPPLGFGKCTRSNKFFMYNSLLGHQCGCGVKGYAPSHSVWVHNKTSKTPPTDADDYYFAQSPTLRLAKKLANSDATLCFSGDSIDYQIYVAFRNNLRRIGQLYQRNFPHKERIVSVVSREVLVKHATKPGNVDDWFLHGHRPPDGDNSFLHAIRPPPGGFGSMYSILEMKATFKAEQSNSARPKARIRYYMSYGWSPWNVDFMEDCNVIIMNLGLHYHPNGNNTAKQTTHTLMDDLHAAITYLSNFTASKDNRIAVWRSALPQHFPTNDGHFHGWKKMQKDSCSAIDKSTAGIQQAYNKVYDEAFSKLCSPEQQIGEIAMQSCDHYRHRCKVNPAADVGYQTIYNFWRANNCTEKIEREQSRILTNLSRAEQNYVTGTIFRWNIFNLFDLTQWHSKDLDCSHFCYIPPLFEAAFERLELLLSPLVASF